MYKAELCHHGILGQKWGKRNGPPYPLGSDISTGSRLKKTFVSGSSKTQDPNSEYYKKKLPSGVRRELKSKMKSGNTILVGDAPGIDRQVQDFLKKKGYKNVEVYSPGKKSRYLADKNWKNKLIDDPKHEPGSPEWLAKKDKAMAKDADEGIAVVLPNGGAKATRNNIARLQSQNKPVSVFELKMNDPNFKKKVAIGAAIIAGTALATYGMYKLGKSDKLGDIGLKGAAKVDMLLKRNKGAGNFLNSVDDLSIVTGIGKNASLISIADSTAKVNKANYLTGNPKARNNCFNAVVADLANRADDGKGLNAKAKLATDSQLANHGISFSDILKPFQGSDQDSIILHPNKGLDPKTELSESIIKKFGNGDNFGIIRVRANGSDSSRGHFIKWEIVNGKIEFSDSLSGTMGCDPYFKAVGDRVSREIEIAKVSGLAINPFALKEFIE